ncbi:MAG: DUF1592 domain-containing protein [Polyangiales bacterium]
MPALHKSFCVALAMLSLTACEGEISDPPFMLPPILRPGPDNPICTGEECADTPEQPTLATRIPRLTHAQWSNTVRDLFRQDAPSDASRNFDPDTASNGDFTTSHRRLFVTAGLWLDYLQAAEEVAEQVTSDDVIRDWLPATPTDASTRDGFIADFGRRVYRRPLTEEQVSRLAELYDEGATHFPAMEPNVAGVRLVLSAMLQSPYFLYRVELSQRPAPGDDDELIELDGYELASRLSYLIWGSMPDDALLAAAADGLDEEELAAHATRMFDDPRALDMFQGFHDEHFNMGSWDDIVKEEVVFPNWRPGLGVAMLRETRALLTDVIENNGNFRDFLLSKKAWVNEDLARIYGIEGITGEEFQEVELGESRAGLLTRLGFLTYQSSQRDPDPIHRGLFVNINVLCRNVPPAPDIELDELMLEGDTNRERVESVTHVGVCQNCHLQMINPPGFALEGFDAIGEEREFDNGIPVDTTTTFTFADGMEATVSSGVELSEAVAENVDAHACYTTHFLEYVFGRSTFGGDSPLLYRMTQGSLEDMSIRDVLLELVRSRTFRLRHGEELETEEPEMEESP